MKATYYIITAVILSISNLACAKEPLTLGIFPYVTTSKLITHNKAIRKYINSTTPYSISLVTSKDLPTYINNLKSYKYDLIFSAPHLARYVEKNYKYKRVVMTTHQIRGVYIAKKDSPIENLSQLKGKTISLTPSETIIHQIVLKDFDFHNIVPGKNITVKPIKTFSNAMHDVINGYSDAAVTGVKIWKRLPLKLKSKLKKISTTSATSGFIILANPKLKDNVITDIQNALMAFNHSKLGERYIFKGFKLIQDKDMESLDFHSKIFE